MREEPETFPVQRSAGVEREESITLKGNVPPPVSPLR
jgi:hypothetical protein